jgi:hypothetical protein
MKTTALLLVLLFLAAPCALAAARIVVDDQDKAPTISGKIGDEAFSSAIRLTADESVPALTFLASDLKSDDGALVIPRGQVALASGDSVKLAAGVPIDVRIKITGVKVPGIYHGTVAFWQNSTLQLKIALTVIAKAPPKLTTRKGTDEIKLQSVNCSWDCGMARWLLPQGVFVSKYPLTFDNDSLGPVLVRGSDANAIGEQSRYPLTIKQLELDVHQSYPVTPVLTIPLNVHWSEIPADHYTGDVQLLLTDLDTRIKLPLDLSVRRGPGVAILMLLFGIALGRLVKYMKDKGGPQSDLLWQLNQLEARIAHEVTPADRDLLLPMIQPVKTQIYQMELEAAKTSLANIRNRLEVLKRIEQVEQFLQGKDPGEQTVAQVQDLIAQARQQVEASMDQQAAQTMASIEQALSRGAEASMRGSGGQPDQDMVNAAEQARAAKQYAGQALRAPAPVGFATARKYLGRITGVSQEIMAEATLWIGRPLLYIVLIVFLVYLGLEQLYIKNPTFGASPLADYAGLLFWAMSSDVASRTLSNIRGI